MHTEIDDHVRCPQYNTLSHFLLCFALNLQEQMEFGNNETRGFLSIEVAHRDEEGRGKILRRLEIQLHLPICTEQSIQW